MSLKAEWRLSELLGVGDAEDPFETVIMSTGLRVDLTGSEEDVFLGLRRSLQLESRLFNDGVTCALKDGGQDCLTCSEYVADRAEEPRAPLCRLGRDQRLMEGRIDAIKLERTAPYRELVEEVERFLEVADRPDYHELLPA